MTWLVWKDNARQGPFSDDELRNLIASGELPADVTVWQAGMREWTMAKHIPGLLAAPTPTTSASGPNIAWTPPDIKEWRGNTETSTLAVDEKSTGSRHRKLLI